MQYKQTFLKVKIKSLTEEARIIRLEKNKAKAKKRDITVNELQSHKVNVVRPEARATHLAYGYMRGKSYNSMEASAKTDPRWDRVLAMLKKYHSYQTQMEHLESWKEGKSIPKRTRLDQAKALMGIGKVA